MGIFDNVACDYPLPDPRPFATSNGPFTVTSESMTSTPIQNRI